MVTPISTIPISMTVYQLLTHASNELKYSSVNELLKLTLSLSANKKLINTFYLEEAENQLKVYRYLNRMMGVVEENKVVHIRLAPELKQYASNTRILASLLFLNVVSTEPSAVYHLTEEEINKIMSTNKIQ